MTSRPRGPTTAEVLLAAGADRSPERQGALLLPGRAASSLPRMRPRCECGSTSGSRADRRRRRCDRRRTCRPARGASSLPPRAPAGDLVVILDVGDHGRRHRPADALRGRGIGKRHDRVADAHLGVPILPSGVGMLPRSSASNVASRNSMRRGALHQQVRLVAVVLVGDRLDAHGLLLPLRDPSRRARAGRAPPPRELPDALTDLRRGRVVRRA